MDLTYLIPERKSPWSGNGGNCVVVALIERTDSPA